MLDMLRDCVLLIGSVLILQFVVHMLELWQMRR